MVTPLAFDTETELITPGRHAPPLACLTCCTPGTDVQIFGEHQAVALFAGAIRSPDTLWIGHNVAYDMGVMAEACRVHGTDVLPWIFKAYAESRVADTMLRQKLADIARGRYRTRQYDLGTVGRIHGFPVNKDDPWRLKYGTLRGRPVSEWPADAVKYACDDAAATLIAYMSQRDRYDPAFFVDEPAQCRKFWALHLISTWGIRTSARGVASLEKGTREALEVNAEILREHRLLRDDGTRDTKAAKAAMIEACAEQGIPVPITATGQAHMKAGMTHAEAVERGYVALDADACDSSQDPLLEAYSEFSSLNYVLSKDIDGEHGMKTGIVYPLHSHFDLADTGRSTSARPNIQNPRRLAGVRECYVPRGYEA
jgi:3'-5' exonuclease